MSARRFLAVGIGMGLALGFGSARAQPMGPGAPDLAQMSGIPRPDSSVPAGQLTVRLLRGDFAHPLVGQKVTLEGPGGPRTATTDDSGHAIFAGLATGGGYVARARATSGGEELASEAIELPGSTGVKLLLVFKAGAPTAPVAVTRDRGVLSIAKRSHIVLEVRDEAVEVFENLVLANGGAAIYDPGPDGLVFPLPPGAEGAEIAGRDAPSALAVEGGRVVLRGQVGSGETPIPIAFLIKRTGGADVELRQKLPLGMPQLTVVTAPIDGLEVAGNSLAREESQDERFWLFRGPAIAAGDELRLRLSGLPHASTTVRDVAATLAALLALWGLIAALRARPGDDGRTRLEAQRRSLLDELAAIEAKAAAPGGGGGGGAKETRQTRRREELLARLEQVYRQLDEAGTVSPEAP